MFKTKIVCMRCNKWIGSVGSSTLSKTKMICVDCMTEEELHG